MTTAADIVVTGHEKTALADAVFRFFDGQIDTAYGAGFREKLITETEVTLLARHWCEWWEADRKGVTVNDI